MAFNIKYDHIQCYHMNEGRPIKLKQSYFLNPYYLVIKSQILCYAPFPGQIILTRPPEYGYEKFFSGVVGNSPDGLPDHHIVVVLQYLSLFSIHLISCSMILNC